MLPPVTSGFAGQNCSKCCFHALQVTSWLRVNKALCQSAAPDGKPAAVAGSADSDSEASAVSWRCDTCKLLR